MKRHNSERLGSHRATGAASTWCHGNKAFIHNLVEDGKYKSIDSRQISRNGGECGARRTEEGGAHVWLIGPPLTLACVIPVYSVWKYQTEYPALFSIWTYTIYSV